MRRGGLVLVVVAACGGNSGVTDARAIDGRSDAQIFIDDWAPQYLPGPPITLAATPGNDEDPAVLVAHDNSLYVAWFSESAGNDIVISRTTDGETWTSPAHVSSGPAFDFGPSLYQDFAGTFHAVWFRWDTGAPPGHIMHNRSADGVTWDPATEVPVTTVNASDDWLPSIASDDGIALIVAFARNTCPPPDECYAIYDTTSTDGSSWTTPALVVGQSGGEEHHAPTIGLDGAELRMVWDPFDTAADAPWESVTTGSYVDIMRYVPGTGWTDRTHVTTRQSAAVTVFPTLYLDSNGLGHVAWMNADASGTVVEEVSTFNLGTMFPSALPITGYSPKIVAAPNSISNVYLGAWVEGPTTDRAVVVQFFTH
jgi:hypothetical protein